MKTKYILGALAVAAALLISCKKDDQDPLAGLKNNQVSWNGKIGDITGSAGWTGAAPYDGVFCSDWECKSLNIAQALDLDGDALNGSTIDLAQLKGVKEGFRISMMGELFHLEAGGGPGEGGGSYAIKGDSGFKEGSCFTEGKFTGKYDEKANSFHVEYWGTLVNGNTIAVKFDVPKCSGGGHSW